jgi:hypothetical protein
MRRRRSRIHPVRALRTMSYLHSVRALDAMDRDVRSAKSDAAYL